MATEKQLTLIRKLAAELDITEGDCCESAIDPKSDDIEDLSVSQASDVIEDLVERKAGEKF